MEKKLGLPIEELEKIAEIFKENNLEEIVIETDNISIKLSKERKTISSPLMFPNVQTTLSPQHTQTPNQTPSVPQKQVSTKSSQKSSDEFADETKYHKLKSKINGTFYRSSSPGAEPFVKEGDHISAGQTLCIIEAMKVMNEIKSRVSGKVIKILKNNAEVVKTDETLMIIEMV